ncbi:MAG TPA: hypothetical protein VJW96_03395 [Terriglobales bacterium]|jgi:hypothetical protein|nr:hypothetical protein [Terriglobales bacterium]
MAARVIPFEDTATAKNISITATDAIPEGCILTMLQNAVTFTNNSGYVIDIKFNPKGIFTDVIGLTPTSPNNFNTQPAPANIAVNYNVTVYEPGETVINGPYAIQTGTGYMVVTVSGSGDNLTNVPVDVAIPVGGNLMMYTSSNNVYPVSWTDGDPFTQPITTVDNASHTDNPQDGSGQFPYQVEQPSPNNTPGAGQVIVRGT